MSPVYKFSNAGGFTSKQRYTSFLAGNPFTPVTPPDTGAMFPLQVITVGPAGASSVTFTNIPSTYTHLQLRGIFRPTAATWIVANFNGDTANNYSLHDLRGNGSAASAEGYANLGACYFILGNATASNTFAAGVVDILDYANTNKYKTTRSLSGIDTNGAGNVDLTSSSWRNTAAITSIVLTINTGVSIPEYSQFALYGIKAAS